MKKLSAHLSLLLVITLSASAVLCGCGTDNGGSVENLELSDTKVYINEPMSKKWQRFGRDDPLLSAESLEVMRSAAADYGDHTISEDKVVYRVFYDDDGNGFYDDRAEDVSYGEMEEGDFKSAAYIRYLGDDIYIDLNTAGRIELYNKQAVRDVLGIDFDLTWSWRPYIGDDKGQVLKEYDLPQDGEIADAYTLNGENVTVSDALSFASDYLNSGKYPHIISPLFTYSPFGATVYRFSNGNCAYVFTFRLNYDGVPMNYIQPSGEESGDSFDIFGNVLSLAMFTKNSVDWIWTPALSGVRGSAFAFAEECEIKADYEKACGLVSETLSRGHTFKVKRAELLYCTRQVTDNKALQTGGNVTEPMWEFTITDTGLQDYSYIYVYVNASTEEVSVGYGTGQGYTYP